MHRFAFAVALLVAPAFAEDPKPITFSKDDLTKLPPGWKAEKTGKGEGSVWRVLVEGDAPSKSGYALLQTAKGPSTLFNLCVADKFNHRDVRLTVAFKAEKGELDQGGGIVWRYRDADNYYVARMNPLEDNFRLYHVIAGVRTQLATKEELKVPVREWHTLSIQHVSDAIECSLDGKKQLVAKDAKLDKAGRIGLWTKADARTWFDQIRVTGLDK